MKHYTVQVILDIAVEDGDETPEDTLNDTMDDIARKIRDEIDRAAWVDDEVIRDPFA